MKIREAAHQPQYVRALMIGLLCSAPMLALFGHLNLAFALCVISGIWCFLPKQRSRELHRSENVRRRRPFLLGLGLVTLTCFHLAIPFHDHDCRRSRSNESAAIATLRNIADAQVEFRSGVRLDRDGDGVGEFGTLPELATGNDEDPSLLSKAFSEARELPGGGQVIHRSGYIYRMFLPEANQAEPRWCCYAWPATYPTSGERVFFVDQSGLVSSFANQDRRYSGSEKAPAIDAIGRDGELWLAVR